MTTVARARARQRSGEWRRAVRRTPEHHDGAGGAIALTNCNPATAVNANIDDILSIPCGGVLNACP